MDFSLGITTFANVAIMMLYLVLGFASRKMKLIKTEHLPSLSMILMYICTPFMIINSFMNLDFSWKMMGNMGLFFIITLCTQGIFFGIMALIFHKSFSGGKYRMTAVGSVLGNVGYFGMPIIRALFPGNPEVLCYSAVYMMSMNIIVYTAGAYAITGDRKYISVKTVLTNPASIGFYVSLPLYIFRVSRFLPDVLTGAFSTLAGLSAPLCMIILGVRLASAPFRDIFTEPFAYLTILLKLIVYPLFAYVCVVFLPLPGTLKASLLVLSSAPCAAVILSLAEVYECERETAAHAILLSTLLCFITIPLMTLFLQA